MSLLQEYFASWYEEHDKTLDLDEIHDDVARPSHPLHDRYEWDDEYAGRQYRKMQIARDIRSCHITYVTDDGATERAREYMANREIGVNLSGYTAAREALERPETMEFLRKALDVEIAHLERRYTQFEGYAAALERSAQRAREARRTPRKGPRKTPPRKRTPRWEGED